MSRVSHWSSSLLLQIALAGVLLLAAGAFGLMWEGRQLRLDPPVSATLQKIRLMPNRIGGTPPEVYFALGSPFESGAYELSQGKRLYTMVRLSCLSWRRRGWQGTVHPGRLVDLWAVDGVDRCVDP